jgi:hypothetical protein
VAVKWSLTLIAPIAEGEPPQMNERAVLRILFEDNVAVALGMLGPGTVETWLAPERRSLDTVREELRDTARKIGGRVVEAGDE